jgi:hypothetical protein
MSAGPSAKDLVVQPISAKAAAEAVRRIHYSGKVVNNSTLHLGAFLGGKLEGVMSFGCPMDKRKSIALVPGTLWNGMLELNRMAFSEKLPRNSESRALSVAFRLIRKHYPHIDWILSFSDGTQCGDGAIYRASGFVLTGINKNKTLLQMPDGSIIAKKTLDNPNHLAPGGRFGSTAALEAGAKVLPGYQMRYVYFLNPDAAKRLAVPILPFSKIAEMGAGMYRGKSVSRAKDQALERPSSLGGETPTCTLQNER